MVSTRLKMILTPEEIGRLKITESNSDHIKIIADVHGNTTKDGKQTNPAISTILHDKPQHNLQLEELYQTYCQSLGFEANEKGARGIDRKYWLI